MEKAAILLINPNAAKSTASQQLPGQKIIMFFKVSFGEYLNSQEELVSMKNRLIN
jgi:hypothetical protein